MPERFGSDRNKRNLIDEVEGTLKSIEGINKVNQNFWYS
jgi:hypothetical protein